MITDLVFLDFLGERQNAAELLAVFSLFLL